MLELPFTLDVGTLIALGSAAVALLSIIVSLLTSRAQHRLSEKLAEDERAMLFEQVRMQRDSDILRWTERSIGLLAEAESVVAVYDPASTSADARAQLRSLRTHLSAVVDTGRMFFPNSRPDGKGQEKPGAYQGERQWILEVLVGAHAVLAKVDSAADVDRLATVARLAEIRREFVSQAQLAIDPRRYMALRELNEIRRDRGLAPQAAAETE